MSIKNIDINVFKLETLEYMGVVNEVKALTWLNRFIGYGEFELWAPVTKDNIELLKKTNILWIGGKSAAKIEKISTSRNEEGDKTLNIKGRTLEYLLTTRVVLGTFIGVNKYIPNIMSDIVSTNCIHAVNSCRNIPFLALSGNTEYGAKISYQKTGGEVYNALVDVGNNKYGFSLDFYPKEKELKLSINAGVDRTKNQAVNNPIVFDTELEDILTSTYIYNDSELKTMVYVAGEGSGSARKVKQTGITGGIGFNRRELYVDARDLQSTITNTSGVQITLSEEEYLETLTQRGEESLSDTIVTETFEATLRRVDTSQYVFGVNYGLGDIITIIDRELQVTVDARVTECEECFDNEYVLNLTLGFSSPTILSKLKKNN